MFNNKYKHCDLFIIKHEFIKYYQCSIKLCSIFQKNIINLCRYFNKLLRVISKYRNFPLIVSVTDKYYFFLLPAMSTGNCSL